MHCRLLTIGAKPDRWVQQGFSDYQKRLQKPWQLDLLELPKARGDMSTARGRESTQLLQKCAPGALRIALDERGTAWRSVELARKLEDWQLQYRRLDFLVGGPDGHDAHLRDQAEYSWSLSPLTLPHFFIRILVAEQLFRAVSILNGHPYHRE